MKKLFVLALFFLCFSIPLLAQDYRGENKIFLTLEMVEGVGIVYESDQGTIEINEDENTFSFDAVMESFRLIDDTMNLTLWNTLFYEELLLDVSYEGAFPIMKLDGETDKKQQVEINGTIHIGEYNFAQPLLIQWTLMDRLVFLDFDTKVSLSDLGIEIPEKYKSKLTGNVFIKVVNGKLTGGYR